MKRSLDDAEANAPTQSPTTGDTVVQGATGSEDGGKFALDGYTIGNVLGRGGMGEVVLARDADIGRDVAIKRMRGGTPSADAIQRFTREAKIQARLDHPAIVPVHEIGRDAAGRPYFTMKRLAGTTMFDVLAHPDRAPDTTMLVGTNHRQRLLRAFVDVCLAIDFAHVRGIIHRDLKPANIMLGDYGEVYVLDWGVARVLAAREDGDRPSPEEEISTLEGETQVGAMLGTPGYMSPEQTRGETDLGTPTDIYSLGALLFEILTEEPLHPPGNKAIASTITNPTESPIARAPSMEIPPELDEVCLAALAEKSADRPTARLLAQRVQRYLDGDRDLERRRDLALVELRRAHDALASSDLSLRGQALQAAGRAIALDPESRDAAAIITRFIIEPPKDNPKELEADLEASEQALLLRQSRLASIALLSLLTFVPLFLWAGVRDWTVLAAAVGTILACSLLGYVSSRVGRVRFPLVAAGQILLVLVLSRVFGPWLVIPALSAGSTAVMQTAPTVAKRPWPLLIAMIAGMFLPLALEGLGVFAPTWDLAHDGIITTSRMIDLGGTPGMVILATANLATLLVLSLMTRSIALAWRETHRKVEIQSWHLRQLLPAV